MRRPAKALFTMAGVMMTTLFLFLAGPAAAQAGYPPGPGPTVVTQRVTPPARAVQGKVAFTGTDILPWVLFGLAAILVGALLLVASRRRHRAGA